MTLSREQIGVLLLSVFVVAICGLTYELMMGAVATTLFGSSVTYFSLTIGVFLSAMGVGSWVSRYITERLLLWFVGVEIAIGLVGGLAGVAVFAAYTSSPYVTFVLFGSLFCIGSLVGLELPLLTRFLEPAGGIRVAISNVMALDYLGALVASVGFPFLLLPQLGLLESFFAVGLLNLIVAGLTTAVFRKQLPSFRIAGVVGVGAVILIGGFARADQMMSSFERRLYADPVIYVEQTPYQRVVITKHSGDVRLYIDGHLQLSSRDEYRYHESLIHPPMQLAASRARVLLLGAGDGLAAREVLSYPDVQSLEIVDLDPAMTKLATTHPDLLRMNGNALADPRVQVHNADAFTWLIDSPDRWSVIILDFPDPHDDGLAKLYSTAMYNLVREHLSPGGVGVTQASSPYFARDAFWTIHKTIEASGLQALPYHAYVPAFGEWGFVLFGSSPIHWDRVKAPANARFLSASELQAMRSFPPDMQAKHAQVSTLDHPVVIELYRQGWKDFF